MGYIKKLSGWVVLGAAYATVWFLLIPGLIVLVALWLLHEVVVRPFELLFDWALAAVEGHAK